jgi:hypothetical protein
MAHKPIYRTVAERPRKVIHVVRIVDEILDVGAIDDLAEKMRERMLSRHGEQVADVVVVQGETQESLRLYGGSHAVSRVRAALFGNAASWSPISLD